jgi:hypothetical protein
LTVVESRTIGCARTSGNERVKLTHPERVKLTHLGLQNGRSGQERQPRLTRLSDPSSSSSTP